MPFHIYIQQLQQFAHKMDDSKVDLSFPSEAVETLSQHLGAQWDWVGTDVVRLSLDVMGG